MSESYKSYVVCLCDQSGNVVSEARFSDAESAENDVKERGLDVVNYEPILESDGTPVLLMYAVQEK